MRSGPAPPTGGWAARCCAQPCWCAWPALIVAALVFDPVLADHFLVVGFLPVLAAAQLVELRRAWGDRRLRPRRSDQSTAAAGSR